MSPAPGEPRAEGGRRGPALIVLIGPPATGKTHMATRLSRSLGAALIQTDAIRKQIFPCPSYTPDESAAVYAEAHRRIDTSLGAGGVTVFDATNLREPNRRVLYAMADGAGADLHLLWMWGPEPLIARRLAQRQLFRQPEDVSDATWPVYRQLASTAQAPTRPFVLLNSTLPVDEILRVVLRITRLRAVSASGPVGPRAREGVD